MILKSSLLCGSMGWLSWGGERGAVWNGLPPIPVETYVQPASFNWLAWAGRPARYHQRLQRQRRHRPR